MPDSTGTELPVLGLRDRASVVAPVNVTAVIVTRGDQELAERFLKYVDPEEREDGCWLWMGAQAGRPDARYGRFWVGRRTEAGHPAAEQAHRVSYELFVGPIPEGLEIDHLCRSSLCVNPEHLEPVTRLENQRRGFAPMQEQRKRTHCPKGHEYTEENTYVWNGMRRCRRCNADHQAARRARR